MWPFFNIVNEWFKWRFTFISVLSQNILLKCNKKTQWSLKIKFCWSNICFIKPKSLLLLLLLLFNSIVYQIGVCVALSDRRVCETGVLFSVSSMMFFTNSFFYPYIKECTLLKCLFLVYYTFIACSIFLRLPIIFCPTNCHFWPKTMNMLGFQI